VEEGPDGRESVSTLMVRAHTPGKRDDKLQLMLLKKLISEEK
jgi:hypothetical protein